MTKYRTEQTGQVEGDAQHRSADQDECGEQSQKRVLSVQHGFVDNKNTSGARATAILCHAREYNRVEL